VIKNIAKRVLGSHYDRLVKIRQSDPIRFSLSVPLYPIRRFQQARNPSFFAVDICGTMGMGAVLTHAIKIAKHADSCGKLPVVISTNNVYGPGKKVNWLKDYVELRDGGFSELGLHYLPVYNEYSYYGFGVPDRIEIIEAHRIFNKYFVLKPIVMDRVDEVLRNKDLQEFDLGIHYRGTDKSSEALDVRYDEMLSAIRDVEKRGAPIQSIFLATDDSDFCEYIQRSLSASEFTTFQLAHVDKGVPRHFSSLSGEIKATEALANMVLLSKSRTCVRTCSYMSALSKILNPALEVYTLNRLRGNLILFPEFEVWRSQQVR
jgi:hypothetical protein